MEDIDLEFLIHNIILPPKLPQEEPFNLTRKDFRLLQFATEIVNCYAGLCDEDARAELGKACKILKWMVDIHNPRHNFQSQLQSGVRNLGPGGKFICPLTVIR